MSSSYDGGINQNDIVGGQLCHREIPPMRLLEIFFVCVVILMVLPALIFGYIVALFSDVKPLHVVTRFSCEGDTRNSLAYNYRGHRWEKLFRSLYLDRLPSTFWVLREPLSFKELLLLGDALSPAP